MFIDYLFFKFHRFFYRAQGIDYGAWCAMVSISCVVVCNIMTLITLLEVLRFLPLIELSKLHVSLLGIILFIICYIYFIRRKRYTTIYDKYKYEDKAQRIKGAIYVWLYIIISFILFVYISMLRYDIVHKL
jgi:hypothetical protein